jgi:glutamate dehydrogenase/leucine dehydrogenase
LNTAIDDIFDRYADELGPAKTVHLYDPQTGMKGIVIIDNVTCGPAIGGVRLAPDIDTCEIFRLARAMTLKNAAAGLPHGGGKAGILADPHLADKETLLRVFARSIRDLVDYIPGPDMGTDERCMGWIYEEIGRCIGRPRNLGGIPLDEIGATGYGLAQVAGLALPYSGITIKGATLAVQGFGNVGRHAASFLAGMGIRLVAASDSSGGIYRPEGLDVKELVRIKEEKGTVLAYPDARRLEGPEIVELDCDLLVPAARPDVITVANVDRVKARTIIEGANIPVTEEAERMLHDRGVLCIPDFIANAGGVICAAVEYSGGREQQAMTAIKEKLANNTQQLLALIAEEHLYPREAARQMAFRRLRKLIIPHP